LPIDGRHAWLHLCSRETGSARKAIRCVLAMVARRYAWRNRLGVLRWRKG
jgi:hypothetical protein